jgi:isoleucyl-tRNA synthetase
MTDIYKDTLNLPHTDFPMKANLSAREPIILKKWDEMHLYQTLMKKSNKKGIFILADGPPYANGDIHLGHALNKILKDMILKSKSLGGWQVPFIPGWDCHGLPVEHNVEKVVGKAGDKIDAKAFRAKCREYVKKQIDSQRSSFIRLGVMADWSNPYITMDFQYEADIIRSLAKIIRNGHLYKGYKPVHWCLDCASALAEAEVEYKDKSSSSIDISFLLNNPEKLPAAIKENIGNRKVGVAVWTTTPWTLPANEAVALHPDHEYAFVDIKKEKDHEQEKVPQKNLDMDLGKDLPKRNADVLIVMSELLESVMNRIGAKGYQILGKVKGSELEGLSLQHPFYDKVVPLILGEHVTLDAGTGAVHTAPAHGQEDYEIGLRYKLPLDNPVGSNGCYISTTPLFAGEHVLKVNDKILQVLEEKGNLLHKETIVHSYPHCWRHKTPLIFRATQQWFIGMEQKGLRAKSLAEIKKVKWVPSWGEARIAGMVEGRPDWCISRQRIWGVPLSLCVHKETGDLHPKTQELMEKVALLVEKSGIDAWYDLKIEDLLGDEDSKHYEKVNDIIDVWFDSGVYHAAVLERRKELHFPADLYLEGSDQHRGWFQSSLLSSVAMNDAAPYRQVLTHGFTVDPAGRKMSKSLGNVVAPEKVVQTLGADVLRLWVSATDYRAEMTVSDEILKRTSDIYRRIRNTARFLLANLNGFNPETDALPANQLLALDAWIVHRTQQLQTEIIQAFEEYNFHIIYQKLQHFCSIDLGSFYLDVIKDRQYTGKRTGIPRRSAQTAIYHIIEALVRWMAPILCFTAEEIWENMPGEREPSVFMAEWYQNFPKIEKGKQGAKVGEGEKADASVQQAEILQDNFWEKILEVRTVVNKALEEARAAGSIGSGLEAEVTLFANPELEKILSRLEDELRFVLITSKATVLPEAQREKHEKEGNKSVATELPGLWVKVEATVYEKCVRCWHRREDVNINTEFPGLCGRCIENVAGEGEIRRYA